MNRKIVQIAALPGRSRKSGLTFIEMMVVVALFVLIFGVIIQVMLSSSTSFKTGHDKLSQQQEARNIMDNIVKALRDANPVWSVNSTNYALAISANNTRIDFYKPEYNSTNEVTAITKVTYKLDPADNTRLLKKTGNDAPVVVSNDVQSINFGGGCAGCASFDCASLASDCPNVKITLNTVQESAFELVSQVSLRNSGITLGNSTVVNNPTDEEEF
jgi:Tfp pilus assembly protein PilW